MPGKKTRDARNPFDALAAEEPCSREGAASANESLHPVAASLQKCRFGGSSLIPIMVQKGFQKGVHTTIPTSTPSMRDYLSAVSCKSIISEPQNETSQDGDSAASGILDVPLSPLSNPSHIACAMWSCHFSATLQLASNSLPASKWRRSEGQVHPLAAAGCLNACRSTTHSGGNWVVSTEIWKVQIFR